MVRGDSSQASAPPRAAAVDHIPAHTRHLGWREIQLPIELQEFDRLCEFENAVLECLPTSSKINAFGCELEFVSLSTQVILDDPIWSTLQECNRFSLVVRQCFVTAEHKGQLLQRAQAICVPAKDTDLVLPKAFSYVPDLRHVQVEPGIRTIGASAWQSCQQLQIVKMPSTVVCLQDGAFQGCYALMMVLAPGCKRFGRRAFAECCSLSQIGTTDNAINLLAPQAQISPYAFESCLALSQVTFEQAEAHASKCTRYLPEGSFCASGIEQLKLPADFNFVGPIACENCKRLRIVDLIGTDITAIWEPTFSHCALLAQIWFPRKLRRIGEEAFLLCSSLQHSTSLTEPSSSVDNSVSSLKWKRKPHGEGLMLNVTLSTCVTNFTRQSGSIYSRRIKEAIRPSIPLNLMRSYVGTSINSSLARHRLAPQCRSCWRNLSLPQ